jgi:hypothetical protein
LSNQALGRDEIVSYLTSHLVGPHLGNLEAIEHKPSRYYTAGVLFPRDLAEPEGDIPDDAAGEVEEDDPIPMSGQRQPSCLGLTFSTSSASVKCVVSAAMYKESNKSWIRQPFEDETITLSRTNDKVQIFQNKALLHSRWRNESNGRTTVTVAIVNEIPKSDEFDPDSECLFQVQFSCTPIDGSFTPYDDRIDYFKSDEEHELDFQYRNEKTYAVGHGCAAHWELVDFKVESVSTKSIPTHEVPIILPAEFKDGYTDVYKIAHSSQDEISFLYELTNQYSAGITEIRQDNPPGNPIESASVDRILQKMIDCESRIRQGIAILESDPVSFEAFRLANEAMLHQRWAAARNTELLGKSRSPDEILNSFASDQDLKDLGFYWRPFQIAFVLMTIESLANKESKDRDLVDLIWFPTGGGKTEAYLLLAAFEIFRRRLLFKNNGAGTAVISRYTLRLLTSQQFERTSTLVCAMERIRSKLEDQLGTEKISIGLWVGQGNTPNTLKDARDKVQDDLVPSDRPYNPFAIQRCPWCHTRLIPRPTDQNLTIGFEATNQQFRIFCPNHSCDFHQEIPVQVVDEAMYIQPPSILLAVVDKFAQLPRNPEIRKFLGGDSRFLAPSLLIQDELHMLGAALGTVFGVYEAAIDTIIQMLGGGIRPKIISSTATIRDSNRQSRNLFGRDCAVFPPPGLDHGNSFFGRVNMESPGRLYVGVLSPNHTPSTSLIRVAALLAQAAVHCKLNPDEVDAYWTNVIYHNSLRLLGRTRNFAVDDIPDWLSIVSKNSTQKRAINDYQVDELTSNVADYELPQKLERLFIPATDPDSLSIVAATNMISVGVDVPRLGLMTVYGQPFSTSEYIQASSRVGRKATHPGLVVTHFSKSKPRDTSHYETFRSFHQAIYRFIEPTSVTPLALPARSRCLPAALVGTIRQSCGLLTNDSARDFNPNDPKIRLAIQTLESRLIDTLDTESLEALDQLRNLVADWTNRVSTSRTSMYYDSQGQGHYSLICSISTPKVGSWPCPTSYRNVDQNCYVEVKGWW